MITLKFINEIIAAEDEHTAEKVLHGQHVAKSQISKNGNFWTIDHTFSIKPRKTTGQLDPISKYEKAGWR